MQHGQPHTGRLTLNTCQLSSQLQSPRDQLLFHSSQLLSSLGRPKLHGSVKGSIPQSLLCHHTTLLKALMSSRLINNMSQETGEPSNGYGNDRQEPSRPTSPPPSACGDEQPPCLPGRCSTHWDEQGRRIADRTPPRPRTRSRSRSRSNSPTHSVTSSHSIRESLREGSIPLAAKRMIGRIHDRHTEYQREMRIRCEENTRIMARKINNSFESGFRQGSFAMREQHHSNAIPKLLGPSFFSGLGAGLLGAAVGALLALILKSI